MKSQKVVRKAPKICAEQVKPLNKFCAESELLGDNFCASGKKHVIFVAAKSTVTILDEIQECPKARQAIKELVGDHRYDYIETGSLNSIKKKTQNIRIPSEETRLTMYPMDYEEFRWANIPIEVKSSGYKAHKSLDLFCEKYSDRIRERYLLYTKDLRKEQQIIMLPVYMTPMM